MEGLTDDEVGEIIGLKPGSVRVRLHRARLFVRKELAQMDSAERTGGKAAARCRKQAEPARQASCKAMFAELSNYLDEQLDDSMCEKLEQHLDACAPCQAFLATLESTIDQLRHAPADQPRDAMAAKLRRDLLAQFPATLANVTKN
jgi:RNA polymerase sigma-70 factor, ECF subfamily